ncbi:MAG: iron-sulfur cluster assembly accessory protein [Flavobacteriales bacterium]|jgi:iron-sulfur cluster assembly protein|nr:iron-sulfur cluster assembly accessory protein [Flavobacteriales bacterium]MBT7725816.1 iron-sulfur cluster assembly accessory protein [Flavobacteriales bacterium]MDG2059252.1 iron-sulfur cluster assembly accessory protein [Flavobacteriales bacterium]|tara:strand:- start:144 stop:467 length:324 start_codon:yes stop_codon:yes gene_type:complete
MIEISDSARDRLLHLLEKKDEKQQFVRVGVESGGCSGLSYKLDFDNTTNEDDELIDNNGIKLLVNKKSFLYLVGTTLEFSDGLNGKGFVFNNPNASRTCGCGESFSL